MPNVGAVQLVERSVLRDEKLDENDRFELGCIRCLRNVRLPKRKTPRLHRS